MIIKNKIPTLITSITIGLMSLTFLPCSNVNAGKIPLNKISRLSISTPDNSYVLVLHQQDCQMAAKLIRDNLQSDLDNLKGFNKGIVLKMTSLQNLEILPSSINCLRLILVRIGNLSLEGANKIIVGSLSRTSYARFNDFVYDLLDTLELL